jgi:N-alpha-acetyltransferase 50
MAHQFFPASRSSGTPTSGSPPSPATYLKHSIGIKNKNKPPPHVTQTPIAPKAPAFKPSPFPSRDLNYQTPHPLITIEHIRTVHISPLSRITGLLLPIRYHRSFYTACITDPVIASLSRVAVYHDHPTAEALESGSVEPQRPQGTGRLHSGLSQGVATEQVIGGIRCRLEPLAPPPGPGGADGSRRQPTNLYIQTLLLLSPYRGNGVAASLLNSLLFSVPPCATSKSTGRVSTLVRHYNIRSVTAHVHETNEDGLKWYAARGFDVEDGIVEGYYRRLRPGGARVVRRVLQWDDEDRSSTCDDVLEPESSHQTGKRQKINEGREEDQDDDWEKVEAGGGDQDDLLDDPSIDCKDGDGSKRKRKVDEAL